MKKVSNILNLILIIPVLIIALPIILIVILPAIIYLIFPESKVNPYKYVNNNIDIDLNKCKNIYNEYYQYFRDGYAFMSFDCSNEDITSQISGWKALPLTNNIDKKVYDIYKEYKFERIETGYYYFIDRNTNQSYSSSNYTLAMYDSTNQVFYYYQYDA